MWQIALCTSNSVTALLVSLSSGFSQTVAQAKISKGLQFPPKTWEEHTPSHIVSVQNQLGWQCWLLFLTGCWPEFFCSFSRSPPWSTPYIIFSLSSTEREWEMTGKVVATIFEFCCWYYYWGLVWDRFLLCGLGWSQAYSESPASASQALVLWVWAIAWCFLIVSLYFVFSFIQKWFCSRILLLCSSVV